MKDRDDEDLLEVTELADHLKVNRRTIARMIEDGRLPPPVRYGGLPRWRWGLLKEWHRAMEALDRMDKRRQSGTGDTSVETSKKQG